MDRCALFLFAATLDRCRGGSAPDSLLRRYRFIGRRTTRHTDGFVRAHRGCTGKTSFAAERVVGSRLYSSALQPARAVPAWVSIIIHDCGLHCDRRASLDFLARSPFRTRPMDPASADFSSAPV